MEVSSIFNKTMIASFGLGIANSATEAQTYFIPTLIESHRTFASHATFSSTRFNDPQRFSLEQLKLNKRKLQTIENLDSNWNGYNGKTFNNSLISLVGNIISNLDYQPQIFPTGRGSIQIEKFIDDANFVEIEVSNEEIFAYQVKNGKEIEKEISLDEINSLISDLYA